MHVKILNLPTLLLYAVMLVMMMIIRVVSWSHLWISRIGPMTLCWTRKLGTMHWASYEIIAKIYIIADKCWTIFKNKFRVAHEYNFGSRVSQILYWIMLTCNVSPSVSEMWIIHLFRNWTARLYVRMFVCYVYSRAKVHRRPSSDWKGVKLDLFAFGLNFSSSEW